MKGSTAASGECTARSRPAMATCGAALLSRRLPYARRLEWLLQDGALGSGAFQDNALLPWRFRPHTTTLVSRPRGTERFHEPASPSANRLSAKPRGSPAAASRTAGRSGCRTRTTYEPCSSEVAAICGGRRSDPHSAGVFVMQSDAYSNAPEVLSVEGEVVVLGPDAMAASYTPEAAALYADRLIAASRAAREQPAPERTPTGG
jgi:hypothetical protein